jgi:hypothetical protein
VYFDTFLKWTRAVADERRNGKGGWPAIDAELRKVQRQMSAADIDLEYVIALLIGLRACERQKDDPDRIDMRRDAADYLRFTKGKTARAHARREQRQYSIRYYDSQQSRLAYGFMLAHGKNWASRTEFRLIAGAVAHIMHVRKSRTQTQADQIYRNFRARISRLRKKDASGIERAARDIFDGVYGRLDAKDLKL